jgi:integrase
MGLWRHRSGRWGIDFHPTRTTRRVRRLVGTKQEAEAVLASLLMEHRTSRYPILATPPPDITFAALADRFLLDHPGSRRSNHYPKTLARLLPHLGSLPLRSITRSDIDRLRIRLLSEPVAKTGRPLTPSTVLKTLRALHRMLKMAVRWGLLHRSPAAEMEMPSVPRHRTRFLSPAEFAALEMAAPGWLRPTLRLAVATGLRLKEIVLLRPENLDAAAGLLHVPEDTKTGYRVVPLNASAAAALRGVLAGDLAPTNATRRRISEATRRATRRAGIDGASFHTLRHTAASWAVQQGASLLEVQRVLGHSSPTITSQIYAHLRPDDLRRATDAIDRSLAETVTPSRGGKPVGAASVSEAQGRAPSKAGWGLISPTWVRIPPSPPIRPSRADQLPLPPSPVISRAPRWWVR